MRPGMLEADVGSEGGGVGLDLEDSVRELPRLVGDFVGLGPAAETVVLIPFGRLRRSVRASALERPSITGRCPVPALSKGERWSAVTLSGGTNQEEH